MRILWLIIKFSVAAFFIVLPIRFFVAQPFLVSGNSMVPTFQDGDYLVIDKLWYDFHAPQRGDIVILRYPLDPSIYLVKRIVGLPGETVIVNNGTVVVDQNGTATTTLQEPYAVMPTFKMENSTTTLSQQEYFVLGDNRLQSSDSREWGPLEARYIIGRAFMRLYPTNQVGILPGQYNFPAK